MSIKIVCGCGFCSVVPSNWRGKRVECKCGRSFVVGEEFAPVDPVRAPASRDLEPPSPAAGEDGYPPQHNRATPRARPPHGARDPDVRGQEPPELPVGTLVGTLVGTSASPAQPEPSTKQRRGDRRRGPARGALLFLSGSLLLAAGGVAASYYFTHLRPTAGTFVARSRSAHPHDNTSTDLPSSPETPSRATQEATNGDASTGTPPAAGSEAATGVLASLTELVPEDGLLLTGLFGDQYQQLGIEPTQQASFEALVERLRENEQQLRSRAVALEQWYAECRSVGQLLLDLLTEAQRTQLQAMLQRAQVRRVQLVEYSARVRPELAVAQMPWSVKPDGERLVPVRQSAFSVAAEGVVRTSAPSSLLAVWKRSEQGGETLSWEVWDLARDEQVWSCEMDVRPGTIARCLSRTGDHLIFVTSDAQGGDGRIDVWSMETAAWVGSQQVPQSDGVAAYQVRDCVAGRVIGWAHTGYWVWNLATGAAREIEFPAGTPGAAPVCAVTAGGEYLAAAHPHVQRIDSGELGFLEICLYRLDTGELLGNQVWDQDYRRASVTAMTWSADGRQLALLCELDEPQPTRALLELQVADGRITRFAEGLMPAAEGCAHRHDLQARDLIPLAAGSGWLANLQQVVDGETGAILDVALPDWALNSPAAEPLGTKEHLVDVMAGSEGRVFVIRIEPAPETDRPAAVRGTFIPLPKLGPFM